MAKFVSPNQLGRFFTKISTIFALKNHTHAKSQITDMPTKLSQFVNDSGYKTTDNNTTYFLRKSSNTITLEGSDGRNSTVDITPNIGFIGTRQITFSNTSGTVGNVVFYGDYTSDEYTVSLTIPSTTTKQQMQAIASAMPIIDRVFAQGGYTYVSVTLLSDAPASCGITLDINLYRTGVSR